MRGSNLQPAIKSFTFHPESESQAALSTCYNLCDFGQDTSPPCLGFQAENGHNLKQ